MMPRNFKLFSNILIFFILITKTFEEQDNLIKKRETHRPLKIDEHRLSIVTGLTNLKNFNKILDNILVPRVVGTIGHDNVRDYITRFLRDLDWTVEIDEFKATTPIFGELKFENIIGTVNPNAERYVVLACHYDSKYFKNEVFLGATDSAVPCAMMLYLAFGLQFYLDQNRRNNEISLKFVFFDGEEAFESWSPTDSIYGARNLAAKWEKENVLSKIDVLVLLDLLGAPDPQFYSFFKETENLYTELIMCQDRLANSGYLENYEYSGVSARKSFTNSYFQPRSANSYVEDDHMPFLERGVPILHIIPLPFPEIWHKITDDREAIDVVTVENLMKIFRVFILEYLHVTV